MARRTIHLAGLLAMLGGAACQPDVPTTTEPAVHRAAEAGTPGSSTGAATPCPNCTFEPMVYTRGTAMPKMELVEFEANPEGAYVLETDDLGTRGAESRIWLNGVPMKVGRGVRRRAVVLDRHNTLETRLTGKPGSQLRISVYQEVASVEVTPPTAHDRYHATRQFTAVARDRNGVEIPRQTFTWDSDRTDIATVGATNGLAGTVGLRHDNASFSYKTISRGVGNAHITAHADGTADKEGTATWTVVAGFVYTTYQAPRRLDDPKRSERPTPEPFDYDAYRLQEMRNTCAAESANEQWWPDGNGETEYRQCYPEMELAQRHRVWVPPMGFIPGFYRYTVKANVGLYGRYCGGGHPGGPSADPDAFIVRARAGNYQPKDPTDAICMEHDRAAINHDEAGSSPKGACIVRYGLENETLYEEGVRIAEGSDRWDAFWDRWPEMKASRDHWINWTSAYCVGPVYEQFLDERGLLAAGSPLLPLSSRRSPSFAFSSGSR